MFVCACVRVGVPLLFLYFFPSFLLSFFCLFVCLFVCLVCVFLFLFLFFRLYVCLCIACMDMYTCVCEHVCNFRVYIHPSMYITRMHVPERQTHMF